MNLSLLCFKQYSLSHVNLWLQFRFNTLIYDCIKLEIFHFSRVNFWCLLKTSPIQPDFDLNFLYNWYLSLFYFNFVTLINLIHIFYSKSWLSLNQNIFLVKLFFFFINSELFLSNFNFFKFHYDFISVT